MITTYTRIHFVMGYYLLLFNIVLECYLEKKMAAMNITNDIRNYHQQQNTTRTFQIINHK